MSDYTFSRRKLARKSDYAKTLDFMVTPPEVTMALIKRERFAGNVWEPACGNGAMSKVLVTAGLRVESSDIRPRRYGTKQDFLLSDHHVDNIITNPPYKLANEFLVKALSLARVKVAFLLRIQFLEGQKRQEIFRDAPPRTIYVFTKRAAFENNMFCHAWFVWEIGWQGDPIIKWIN